MRSDFPDEGAPEKSMSAATENPFASGRGTVRPQSPFVYFLVFVFALFIGILIFCYAVTKRANPVFLDSHGRPVAEGAEHSHH